MNNRLTTLPLLLFAFLVFTGSFAMAATCERSEIPYLVDEDKYIYEGTAGITYAGNEITIAGDTLNYEFSQMRSLAISSCNSVAGESTCTGFSTPPAPTSCGSFTGVGNTYTFNCQYGLRKGHTVFETSWNEPCECFIKDQYTPWLNDWCVIHDGVAVMKESRLHSYYLTPECSTLVIEREYNYYPLDYCKHVSPSIPIGDWETVCEGNFKIERQKVRAYEFTPTLEEKEFIAYDVRKYTEDSGCAGLRVVTTTLPTLLLKNVFIIIMLVLLAYALWPRGKRK